MPLPFGEMVRLARIERGWSQRELARRIKKSATYVHYVEGGQNAGKTSPMKVSPDAVDAIAKALGLDEAEARLAAGYAPASLKKPTNLKELIEALEFLGLPVPQLHGGFEKLVEDSGGFEEALQRIYLDLTLVLRRHETGGKVTFMELPLTEEGEKRKWK